MDTARASLGRDGGPCAHSIPIEASKSKLSWKLSLVGLGGPAVLGCLPTKLPWFGCPPGCPFINATALGGEGDVETPPHEQVRGVESCERRDSTAELQVVLVSPVTGFKDIKLRPSVSDLAAGFPLADVSTAAHSGDTVQVHLLAL